MNRVMSKETTTKCDKCSTSLEDGGEFVQCHDESKKHKACGAVWCLACYDNAGEANSKGAWYYDDEDALPVADEILVHTDLCPKCVQIKET